MSDHTNGEVEAESAPGGSPPSGNGPSKNKASPITPTPVKKSKRQAERSAKGAFAASLRKEEEESKLYQSKKQKTKKLPKSEGDNNSSNDAQAKPKQAQSNAGKEGEEALQAVTPSPTQSLAGITKPTETSGQSAKIAKTKTSTKTSELGLSVETVSNGEHLKRPRDKTGPNAYRKRRKLVYKAVSGSTQTIYKYTLDLLSHVCNNAYNLPPPKKITPKTPSPKNDDPSTFAISKGPQEAHRILDRPISGYTLESEPERERCMRLQLRQRFASATAIGMSPIEFAGKLLKLWGGKLEQVYETHNSNPLASLTKKKSKIKKGKLQNDFATMSNDGSNGAIAPYAIDHSLHPDDQFNGYESDPYNPNRVFHGNSIPANFNSDIFGESKARMERANKLLKRKYRKDRKKAEKKAPRASMTVNSAEAPTNLGSLKETIGKEKNALPRRKLGRRTPRKLMDDPSIPVLYKGLRLAHPDDPENVNTLHCFVRSKLLEVYVLHGDAVARKKDDGYDETSNEEPTNLVGIRCAFCGSLPKSKRGTGQTMAVFFPKSIGEIYRGVCTWQRIHFPACLHMPEEYRREYKTRKEMDLTRGKKIHWIKSAYDLGLRNIDSMRSGLTYRPDAPYDIEEVLKIEVDPGGGQYKTKKATSDKKSPRNDPQEHAVAPLSPGGHDEFELFGTDFDRSLEDE